VFVDPNCRPLTIPDRGAYIARLHRVLARADVVKVSGDDLDYLAPGVDGVQACRDLLALGPQVVLFTDGAETVHVLTRGGDEFAVAVPSVEVVDTVGAGDSFGGGFLATWVDAGLDRTGLGDVAALERAVERAVVVAGITCTRAGAEPPRLDDLPA
jgi:fructokinase